jgi:hypothetical protein
MKKLIVILSVAVLCLTACKKEDNIFLPDCNCGLVVSDRVQDYSVVIRSDCSGNEQRFYLAQGDWMNAHPGRQYCITNSTGWRDKGSKSLNNDNH